MEHFDFTTKRAINPLESVTRFFVSPYQMCNANLLNIEKRSESVMHTIDSPTVSFYRGMPIVLFDIDCLELGTCLIKWRDIDSGVIISKGAKVTTTIYFKIIDVVTLRVDTVLIHQL